LEGIAAGSVHHHGNIAGILAKLNGLEMFSVRTAVGAGAAGFLASVDVAVTLMALEEQFLTQHRGTNVACRGSSPPTYLFPPMGITTPFLFSLSLYYIW